MCSGGGGRPWVEVSGSRIEGNGGIGVTASNCRVVVERSEVVNSGGVGISVSSGSVVVERSEVRGNRGGGIKVSDSDFEIVNTLVVENGTAGSVCGTGSLVGGVLIERNGTTAADRFVNNTVADNMACTGASPGVLCGAVTSVDIRNTLVWGNRTLGGDAQVGGTGCTVTSSWVEGLGGATDPKFVGGVPRDYHLEAGSPCIDKGTSAGAPSEDLEGKARVGAPDIGCYEWVP